MKNLNFIVLQRWILVYLGLFLSAHGCPCGKRRVKTDNDMRIVGGNLSKENAWPWTVGRGQRALEQFCGASLIDNRYVMTAAHCVHEIVTDNKPLSEYQIFMGDTRLNGSSIVRYNIDTIKSHPNYNPNTLSNDIALIRLTKTVQFSERISPICTHQPKGKPLRPGEIAIVVGWGATRDDGPTVNSQREVRLRIVRSDICVKNYRQAGIQVTPRNMLCASRNHKDSCTGDSGGPLFRKRSGDVFEQTGIVSFGRRCAENGFPGIYTKVSAFKKFIEDNTRDGEKCTG